MTARIAAGCVLLAAAVAGLLFAPVFGVWPLVPPIAVVLVACYAVWELSNRFRSLGPWRPMLALGAGLAGLGTVTSMPALLAGVTESWQLTLQTTWPVRPDPELLLFVPLSVLFAAVLGIELLRWPAIAVLPSLAVLGLSQAFAAASGAWAILAALCYAALVAGLLRVRASTFGMTALVAVVAALVFAVVGQGRQPSYSLHHNNPAPVQPARTVNPLDELAARLGQPDVPVFSYTSPHRVDRWRLVVLDRFNGVAWSAGNDLRRLGAELRPASSITVPTTVRTAQVWVPDGEPWLPSQAAPASVTGVSPLIAPDSGMLLAPDRVGPVEYRLSWWEPVVEPGVLAGAALDPAAQPTDDLGVIPPGIAELARTATGGLRPSFQTALVLERYLTSNYRIATGANLPTGAGWPQLRDFLLTTKRGTSAQFAAAYVALAKIVGIPARVAVGYRAPKAIPEEKVVVRNGDALAWPEVAVADIGWVPLDPTGNASGSIAGATGLARITALARAGLPPQRDLRDPPLPDSADRAGDERQVSLAVWPAVLGLPALLLLAIAGIPLWRVVRTWRRKRRTGAHGVVAAWQEARDLLRAHGLPVTPGMTVRDLARIAAPTAGPSVVDGLFSLAHQVDVALWSGSGADSGAVRHAWKAVRDIRRGLAARPLAIRVRALFAM
ncbi:transglutaminaseTgpA domain-containing protein [Allorhizocola rhizosphaerae]|uniref:transglutaminase family protein n=1 Tax=Allorhizocola rhizosphaerae TaxID=1872709 RepID=UPI000E3C02B2|nr:transglutaminaseTgpA domain-containing protein [Allorhizocola rhizosphaerae]